MWMGSYVGFEVGVLKLPKCGGWPDRSLQLTTII